MTLDSPGTRRSVNLQGLRASLSESPLRSRRMWISTRLTAWLVMAIIYAAGVFTGAICFGVYLIPHP